MAKKPKLNKTNMGEKPVLPEDFCYNSAEDYATYVAEWEQKVKVAKNPTERDFAERTLRYWQLALAYAKFRERE